MECLGKHHIYYLLIFIPGKVRDIAVILTDGLANIGLRQMLREIRYAKRDGIHIVPVGAAVGGRQEMINMASDKENGVFFSPTFRELNNISDDLVRYLLEGMRYYVI